MPSFVLDKLVCTMDLLVDPSLSFSVLRLPLFSTSFSFAAFFDFLSPFFVLVVFFKIFFFEVSPFSILPGDFDRSDLRNLDGDEVLGLCTYKIFKCLFVRHSILLSMKVGVRG